MLKKLTVTAALAMGIVAVPAAAYAGPAPITKCYSGQMTGGSGDGGFARCNAGYGWVRVRIECWNDYSKKVVYYGSWVGRNKESYAWCNSRYPNLGKIGHQTRNL
ncbi:hypothetical protein ACIBKY_41470 [Nonomuraea sp. NPDC050394]|uniref:hypothetical protein n=1 Tax=Nonomuraea sp. NPDC050394 TaxID=3364363 RepID=UPI0037AA0327